jgi:TonB family protein
MATGAARSATRRIGVLAVVALAHGLLVIAFLNGLGVRVVQLIATPVQVSVIQAARLPPPPPPPIPEVQLQASIPSPLLLSVPLPLIDVDLPTPKPLTGRTGPTREPVYVPLALLTEPNTDPYYPPEAVRRHLTGHTLTRVCVDAGAHLASAQVVQSSGFRDFDTAALVMIRHMVWKAATLDGKPISDCHTVVINFILRHDQRRARR